MRPVNLIPPEEQSAGVGSARGPLRTGPAAYIIIGALALGLVLVIAMAITSKQITDKTAEKSALEQELASATATGREPPRVLGLPRRPGGPHPDRVEPRPEPIRLGARPARALPRHSRRRVAGEAERHREPRGHAPSSPRRSRSAARFRVPPSTIVGCAPTQDAVAGFVAALEDIDGVTRVGVGSSSRSETESAAPSSSGAGEETREDCRTTDTIYKFEIAIAFDSVPTPPAATPAPAVPSTAPSTSPSGQLADTPTTEGQTAADQTAEAQEAANMVPGAGG